MNIDNKERPKLLKLYYPNINSISLFNSDQLKAKLYYFGLPQ